MAGSRDNAVLTIIASAARTASMSSNVVKNTGCRGGYFFFDVGTVAATSQSVTFTVEAQTPGTTSSTRFFNIFATTPIKSAVSKVAYIYPSPFTTADAARKSTSINYARVNALPAMFRVRATLAKTNSVPFSVGALLVD